MKSIKNNLLFLLLFTFFQTGFSQNPDKKTIVMYGNSITFQGKWEEVLGRTDVANRGIPGYTTGQLIWTIKNGLKDHPDSKIWFLEGGINDISLGVPVERIFENYKMTVDSLRRNLIIPVVQSTILKNNAKADNKKVNALNKLVRKYCLRKGIDYIDLNKLFSLNGELKKENTIDGCHLVQSAYIHWATEIKKVLSKYKI
jgi:lysophospholipase L1-like esterase